MSKLKQFSEPGLPLTPPVFYVLLSLSIRERHGYDILKDVQTTSERAVRLGPGALYTTLKRLLEEGLILEVTDRVDITRRDERRRYYRITGRGSQVLGVEVQRLEHAVAIARQSNIVSGMAPAIGKLHI